jgi:hypothetical protein
MSLSQRAVSRWLYWALESPRGKFITWEILLLLIVRYYIIIIWKYFIIILKVIIIIWISIQTLH